MYDNTTEPFPLHAAGQICDVMNATEKYCENQLELDTLERVAYRIVGPTVAGVGLLGNVLNLIVLTRPSFKGVTYTYLIALAGSDMGVLLCAVSMMIRQTKSYSADSWIASFFFAHMELPLSNTFMASSIFIVVCLTVDRFAAICAPTKFKSVHTSQICRTAIFICYLLAILISVPLVKLKMICTALGEESERMEYSTAENYDVTHSMIWHVYSVIAEVIVRFGPALILTVLNTMIIRQFRQISQKRREMKGNNVETNGTGGGGHGNGNTEHYLLRGEAISKKTYKEEKRLVVLLMSIVLLFFVTTTPVAFLNIFYTDKLDCNVPFQIFRALANCLELCNFALNFYIYFLCSKEFRKKFLSFFQILLPRKSKGDFRTITLPEISHAKTKTTCNKNAHSV